MDNCSEMRLMELLKLIDAVELQLMSIEALVALEWNDSITKDDLLILLNDVIEKCRHDI